MLIFLFRKEMELFHDSWFTLFLSLIYSRSFTVGRLFKKIELNESIRYASGDPIESWLHGLLCLDATNVVPKLSG